MRGRVVEYIAEELVWIEAHKEWPREQLHRAFCFRFGRQDVTCDNIKALCSRKGWSTSHKGRFAPGVAPANKGKTMPFNPNTARTQFKARHLPHNTKYLGHERVTRDGYVEISVAETNPHTGYERRYVQKHRWLWEQANGPVPDGMRLKCLDGDRTNTDPSNWEALPIGMAPRLNGKFGRGYDAAPAEIKPTIMAIAKLQHAARSARKGTQQ